MFADAKDIETDLVGQVDCLEQFAQMPRGLDGLTGFRINAGSCKAIQSNFHV
jgi:hypothetical protein